MQVFTFDGSFEGLLSVVFDAYTRKVFPDVLLRLHQTPPLLTTARYDVVTDKGNADRVLTGLEKRLSKNAMRRFLYAWLSEEEGGDLLLFRFMQKVFDTARSVADDFSDPVMLRVEQLAAMVRCDAHRIKGFARFQKTAAGMYVAVIGPRHNVLPLVMPHFMERFNGLQFALYDETRAYGLYYDGGRLHDMQTDGHWTEGGKVAPELLAKEENVFQEAWKGYCRALSIEERRNPKVQTGFMPRRFWKYMAERAESNAPC